MSVPTPPRPPDVDPAEHPGVGRDRVSGSDATAVGLASAAAAASGFLALLLVARTLSIPDNADFLVFWSLMFGAFGVSGGITNETTRSVGSSVGRAAVGPRVMGSALLVGVALSAVVVLTSPAWATAALGSRAGLSVVVLAVAVLAFSGECGYAGVLSGQARWRRYAVLLVTEAGLRLALVAVACAVGAGVLGLEVAAAVAAATWLVVVLSGPAARVPLRARSDALQRQHLRRVGQAMLGTASSAALVVGFPVLLRLTSTDGVYAHSAPLVLAVSLTRAPLLIPLGAYQGMVITHVLSGAGATVSLLRRSVLAVVGVGAAGATAAFVAGPTLMSFLFGSGYRVVAIVLAGLTVAAAILALLTLSGAVLLALDEHRSYAIGWLVATVGCVGILLVPSSVASRTVLSLVLGPVLGLGVHAAALRRHGQGLSRT